MHQRINRLKELDEVDFDAVAEALRDAGVALTDIQAIGVTAGPGLVGSLLVGIETAKAIAYIHKIPCLGLNHLEGHLTAPLLESPGEQAPSFPYVGLVASGGHSDLYLVRGLGDYDLLGRTRDDAAGEAFDKVAKMLGLPYPGGVEIDRLAMDGRRDAIDFPRPMWTRKNLDFSFSGLKTAVLQHIEAHGVPEGAQLNDLCASFQAAVVDVLVMKTMAAARQQGVKSVVVSGGVACNSELRQKMREAGTSRAISVHIAPARLCTDNAAMLGPVAHHYAQQVAGQGFESFELNATSSMKLGQSERTQSAGNHR